MDPMTSRSLAFTVSVVAFLTTMAAAGAPSVLLARYQSRWHFPDGALSVAFAIYALVLVVILLTCGSVSDRFGRRRVAIGSLVLSAAAAILFLSARGIVTLIVARAIQGAATGIGTTVFSASVVELASVRRRRTAEVLVSITTAGGLGIGVVLAGAAARFAGDPTLVVFGSAFVIVVAAALLLLGAPETAPPQRRGVPAGLSRRLRVGSAVGAELWRIGPGMVGIWMSAGLILGLGSSLARASLHVGDSFIASWVVAAQPLTATICMIVLAPLISARRALVAGLFAALVGVGIEGAAFIIGSPALVLGGAIVTGVGFGAVFSGTLRSLLPLVRGEERAGFFAVFYLIGYVAYGGSAIAAGIVSDALGLQAAAMLYAAATMVVVAAAIPLAWARRAAALQRQSREDDAG